MKTAVDSWRPSSEEPNWRLKRAAKVALSALLDRVTADRLVQRRNGHSDDDAKQAAIRRRAMAPIGSVAGGDLTRSERASERVQEII
jgi:hypothetical protein